MSEPGEVIIGEWAHLRYHARQHLVVADEPEVDKAEPIRMRCGVRTWRGSVWHTPGLPHMPKCKRCLR